jgi:hypothetical protein
MLRPEGRSYLVLPAQQPQLRSAYPLTKITDFNCLQPAILRYLYTFKVTNQL